MKLPLEDAKPAIMRLKRAKGQLEAVIRSLESEQECAESVTQLAAVAKAIDRAGYTIILAGMKKCFVVSAVAVLALTMGACSVIIPKSAPSSESKASVETAITVESEANANNTESGTQTQNAADKEACEFFGEAAKSFKRPTVDPNKEPEKYMDAMKPMAAPAYKAAEKANDPQLKEAFKAFGTMSENGLKTDPNIAKNMTNYVMTMLKTCQSLGVNTDPMIGK